MLGKKIARHGLAMVATILLGGLLSGYVGAVCAGIRRG